MNENIQRSNQTSFKSYFLKDDLLPSILMLNTLHHCLLEHRTPPRPTLLAPPGHWTLLSWCLK